MFSDGGNMWGTYFLIYLSVCCVIPMIVLAVGAVIAFRRGSSFVSDMINPDVEKMKASYEELRQQYPEKDADELVQVIIRRQSFRCGVVGAVTSLGGFITLPIALPVDMVVSYRIQGAMVNFIAHAYGHDPKLMQEEQAVASLVMFGSRRITQTGMRATTSLLTDLGGKALSKLVPLAGAILGFLLNMVTTQATGQMAATVYSGRAVQEGKTLWGRLRRVFRRGDGSESSSADHA